MVDDSKKKKITKNGQAEKPHLFVETSSAEVLKAFFISWKHSSDIIISDQRAYY